MRITSGKVVDGHIEVQGESLHDGLTVTVLVPEESSFTLDAASEAELLQAIKQADRGELLDARDVLPKRS
ncbi:MAG: hypothetical protein EXQ56_00405 [Acidobacteria bacterium]|nr:hypothetical protein [Acidobacteriota bacterium]